MAANESAQVQDTSLVLHHLNDSRSQRILWLLEELGLPYEIQKYERLPSKLAPKELKAIHPLGKSPVITDGDVTLAESGAIVEYLITKYGKGLGQPPDSGWVDNIYYTHYAEGTLMPLLSWKYILTMIPDRANILVRPLARSICNSIIAVLIDSQLAANFNMIDKHLQKCAGNWIAGGSEPTSADYMMLFGVEAMSSRSNDIPESIKTYVAKIHARPAYQRALEKGGKYSYAG